MTNQEFIAYMKRKAVKFADESERARWRFRKLSFVAASFSLPCFVLLLLPNIVLRVVGVFGLVVFGLLTIAPWRDGERHAAAWLELRDEALRNADDARQGKL